MNRTIPALLLLSTCFATARAGDLPDADDVADVEALDVLLDDDPLRRYVLIGLDPEEKPPKDGYRLLLILPGGTGAIDFHPFCKRIAKHALDDDWLAVQVVAPVWAESQAEKLVWPTEKNPWKGMKFSTEELVYEVVEDVRRRAKIDPRYVFSMTWSSSGPAGYAMSLQKESPITGTFVAMSVFKPDQLPSLSAAKKHPYFLLHSPTDFIPIRMAHEAEKKLGRKKAVVKLVEYEGGHGWHGNVFGNMRTGVEFLEQNAAKPKKRKKTRTKANR